MEFGWSPEDDAFRRELIAFLDDTLPPDWETLARAHRRSLARLRWSSPR